MNFSTRRLWLATLVASTLLAGCGSLSENAPSPIGAQMPHKLKADAKHDSPDFLFLEIQYWLNGKRLVDRRGALEKGSKKEGFASLEEESSQVGDTLYVKWRHVPSGVEYENTLDLRKLLSLPLEEGATFYFVLAHKSVHVYHARPALNPGSRKPFYTCDMRQKAAKAHPRPDNTVAALYCARTVVMKIYPEQSYIVAH